MSQGFIHENFLLQGETARRLYHEYAADMPILDYHCHLPPKDLAENRCFANLFEIWLEGDHYKWRAMRANGIDERFCTGNAEPYDKFLAWARTVPKTLRNPLYHWTHLELRRYFGIDLLLNEDSAPEIWREANKQLADEALRPQGIAARFKVEVICTTDDPADSLEHHQAWAAQKLATQVFPAFRPDQALAIEDAPAFNRYADRLGQVANQDTGTYAGFCQALRLRHDFFHAQGCRLSDHGLTACHATFAPEVEVAIIFAKTRAGQQVSPEEKEKFATAIMLLSGQMDAAKGWVKQLHLGAQRNNNTRALATLGRDTGFDSIGDAPQGLALARYLDRLEQDGALPKTILYNNNPRDNYLLAALIGNFQDGSVAGKMQFGSGWWFLDQKEGIEWQLNALSNNGLLSRFVGMLTDSRSFLSYPRHEYFRRVLCNLLGQDMERGELPNDLAMLGEMVRDICYRNARAYFPFSHGGMFKVVIPDCLQPPLAIEEEVLGGLASFECLLARSAEELRGRLADADAVILYHEAWLDRALIQEMTRCRVIVRGGVGYDNVDLRAAGERGIPVCNVPDYGVDEVADHAIGLMLTLNRGIMVAERKLRHALVPWDRAAIPPVPRLSELTLGIIGCGRIGAATALRARALKMRVLVCDPYLRPGMDKTLGVTWVDLPTLLAESDVVSLHVPLTEETRHLINAETLARMQPASLLVNTARGAVVDTDALAAALRAGRLGGAAIDVLPTEPPHAGMELIKLWQEEHDPPVNLVITPHVAYYSESGLVEMRRKGSEEVARVLRGEPPRNCVNREWIH